jgi:hypothetical protein
LDHGGSVPPPVMASPTEPETPEGSLRPARGRRRTDPRQKREEADRRGFGAARGGAQRAGGAGRGRRRRGKGLSRADWGPLGKHPPLDAIVARQRLGLPLSGRLGEAEVNRAWKTAAAEHHPDRGGAHDTMQAINGARDLLLGRGAD